MIDKLSTEIKQTVLCYVNRVMTKGMMIDINCIPLVELKIILLLCSFCYFTTSFSESLGALLFIGLLNTRSEAE